MVGVSPYGFFFFFKQKTAYEMLPRLEFRRVLFRSMRNSIAPAASLPAQCCSASKKVWLAIHGLRSRWLTPLHSLPLWSAAIRWWRSRLQGKRSEERRVGKDSRGEEWLRAECERVN